VTSPGAFRAACTSLRPTIANRQREKRALHSVSVVLFLLHVLLLLEQSGRNSLQLLRNPSRHIITHTHAASQHTPPNHRAVLQQLRISSS
jgi:hypothetical protein